MFNLGGCSPLDKSGAWCKIYPYMATMAETLAEKKEHDRRINFVEITISSIESHPAFWVSNKLNKERIIGVVDFLFGVQADGTPHKYEISSIQ